MSVSQTGQPSSPVAPSEALEGPILFYDGDCGVCSSSVSFMLRHERRDATVRFARLGGPVALRLLGGRKELDGIDSLVWFEPASGRREDLVRVRTAAVVSALKSLGGVWAGVATVLWCVPPGLRDRVYCLFARHRRRFNRPGRHCPVLPADSRWRFLDPP